MTNNPKKRREFLSSTALTAMAAVSLESSAADLVYSAADSSSPWPKRFFNLFTNDKGVSEMRQIPIDQSVDKATGYLIRHEAARVTIGTMAPNFMMDFHVANQPNILIPLFGMIIVELENGERFELVNGDILFAEDCTGLGHKSGAGPEGQFGVSIQLDMQYCPKQGESYLDSLLSVRK